MKKRIASIFTLTMLLMAAGSEAAEIKSVLVTDFNNSVLTVSGVAEEEMVSITAVPEGTEISAGQYAGTDDSNISIQYADVTDKKFSVSFSFAADTGKYDVYVSGCEKPYKFEFISKELILQFVADLGDKNIAETDIFDKLSYFATSMGADVSFATDAAAKSALAKNMIYYADNIKTGGIAMVNTITAQTKSELEFLKKLSETQTVTGVNKQLTDYAMSAKLDLIKYNALSDYDKNAICTAYTGKSYTDIHTFRTEFANDVDIAANTADPVESWNGGNTGGNSSGGGSGSKKQSIVTIPENTIPDGVRVFDKFSDIDSVSWAWDAILHLSDKGIINGVGNNSFAPNDYVTREQIAKIITVAFGKVENGLKSDFEDTENDGWSETYIASAKKNGLMVGLNDKIFGYGQSVTRQDLCVIVYRAAKSVGMNFEVQKSDFTDYEKIADYAKEAISYLAGSGIVSGVGDGNFAPNSPATRAQAAKVLYDVLGGTK